MAKEKSFGLSLGTIIEVISINKNKKEIIIKKEMTFGEWIELKKNKNYHYIAYQKGFSQFKI